jgi:hypothetical protein
MVGLLYTDSKNIRTGLRPFEAVLNELIAHYGCARRVCRAGHLGWSTIETLRVDHKISRITMQKLMNLHAQMREEQLRLENAA